MTLQRHMPDGRDQKAADAAFALRVGEISALLEAKESLMLIQCVEHAPAEKEGLRRWPELLAEAGPEFLLR